MSSPMVPPPLRSLPRQGNAVVSTPVRRRSRSAASGQANHTGNVARGTRPAEPPGTLASARGAATGRMTATDRCFSCTIGAVQPASRRPGRPAGPRRRAGPRLAGRLPARPSCPQLIEMRRQRARPPRTGPHGVRHHRRWCCGRWRPPGSGARLLPSGTGVVAEIGSGDRLVALRADIDALPLQEQSGLPFASTVPGVCHACGHDVHTTALIGAAQALARAGDLPGPGPADLPAGRGGHAGRLARGGRRPGALDGVERIFALHCDPRLEVGKVGLRVGPITSTSDVIEHRAVRRRAGTPPGRTSPPIWSTRWGW